jgi:hypothetical protein
VSQKESAGHALLRVMLPPLGTVGDQLFGCTAHAFSELEAAAVVECVGRMRDKEVVFCGSANHPALPYKDHASAIVQPASRFPKDEIPHHTMVRVLSYSLAPV